MHWGRMHWPRLQRIPVGHSPSAVQGLQRLAMHSWPAGHWLLSRQKPEMGEHLPAWQAVPSGQSRVSRHCWHLRATQNSLGLQSESVSQEG